MTPLVIILFVVVFVGGVIAATRIKASVHTAVDDLYDILGGMHERLDEIEASVKAKLP